MEHDIVDRYANMINDEVQRYKTEMLDYFHVEEVSDDSIDVQIRQIYTTSIGQTPYRIEDYNENSFVPPDKIDQSHRTTLNNTPFNNDDLFQPAAAAFLTEDLSNDDERRTIPFINSFEIPSNLVHSIMFK